MKSWFAKDDSQKTTNKRRHTKEKWQEFTKDKSEKLEIEPRCTHTFAFFCDYILPIILQSSKH